MRDIVTSFIKPMYDEVSVVLKQDLFESRGVQIHNIVTKILAWHKIEIDKLKSAVNWQKETIKARDDRIEKLEEAIKEILEAKRLSDTTPELLLSSHHAKSDECAAIMKRYIQSFEKADQILKGEKEVEQ